MDKKDVYEAILHHLPQGILLFTEGGQILYSNRSFAHALDYELPDLLQFPISVFQPDKDAPPRNPQILAECQRGKCWQGDVTYNTRSGTPRRFHLSLSILQNSADSPFLALHSEVKPISVQQPPEDMQDLLAEIIKRIRAVSHDINNPLTTLFGNIELALMQLQESDPLHKRLSTILRQAERIRETVIRLQEIKNLSQSSSDDSLL